MNGSGFIAHVRDRPTHTETAQAMRLALVGLPDDVDSLAGVQNWLQAQGTWTTLRIPIREAWRRYRQTLRD